MENNWFYQYLLTRNLGPEHASFWGLVLSIGLILLIIIVATVVLRKIVLRTILKRLDTTTEGWRKPLLDNRVVDKISWFIPVLLLHLSLDSLLPAESAAYIFLKRTMLAFFVIVTVLSINSLLSMAVDGYRLMKKKRADVLKGFVDAGKIGTFIIGTIFLVSIFSGVSPWGIISVLGGMTAVTMLVFKDTILGFVASIQLTTTDMVRVGDWVELPTYGADGDVVSMSIHTIRVQNWDKTITTVPTYALVENSFKNWRGMSESGGRRIKRALMIDISSIRFCDAPMLKHLSQVHLLEDYLISRSSEIEKYNQSQDLGNGESPINGRRQTNIGVFRAYVVAYLKANPNISRDMTFLVRQLSPTQYGLPLEIYVFSKDQRWANYEKIQADIFDHLFAALPEFGLRAFQSPSGFDLSRVNPGVTNGNGV